MVKKMAKIFLTIVIITITFVIIMIILCPLSCFVAKITTGIEIVGPSWLIANEQKTIVHDHRAKGSDVYYNVEVCLRNSTNQPKTVTLKLFSIMDVLNGLLISPIVDAVDENGDILLFTLKPYETQTYDRVIFRGSRRGERNQRWSRLLPAMICLEKADAAFE